MIKSFRDNDEAEVKPHNTTWKTASHESYQ